MKHRKRSCLKDKLTRSSIAGFLLFLLLPLAAQATPLDEIFITELRVDQTGADDDEFIELSGTPGESLEGLSFVILQDNGTIDGCR